MSGWALLPTLVLRTAGFPWQTVDRLRWRHTAPVLDRVLEHERRLEALRSDWPGGRPTRGQAARLRNGRPLSTKDHGDGGFVASWNAEAGKLASAHDQLSAAAGQDAADVGAALRDLAEDTRFLDAVVCSSPGVYRDLRRDRTGSARIRRQLGSYAQRLATKCETMSFFGPINYAHLDPAQPASAVFRWDGATTLARRTAYLSAWAVHRLQEAPLAVPELAGRLVPRRKTVSRPPTAGGLDDPLIRLIHSVDGNSTLTEIAARCGLDLPTAASVLRAGMERGLLTHNAVPDATAVDQARWLAARLAVLDGHGGPDTPAGRARTAVALLDRYPAAEPDRKLAIQRSLTELVGGEAPEARRDKFYNDRVVVHEAAAGTVALTLGGELAADLRRAVPAVLELLGHAAVRTRVRANALLAQSLGPGRFPLARVLRGQAELALARDSWLPDRIAEVLATEPADAVEVDVAGRVAVPPETGWPLLCSVDVMIAAADLAAYHRDSPLVLGDIHDTALLTPWALQFHPAVEEGLASRDAAIAKVLGDRRAVSVVSRRATGLPPLRFPGLLLELGPVGGPAEPVLLDRLYVHSDGDRAELRSADHQGELFFHNGELDSGVHTALGLPRIRRPALPDQPYLPRLRYGQVVLSRRRWQVDATAIAAIGSQRLEVDRLLAVRRLARGHGLPARVFAKAAHERKPIFVDLASPVLLDGLVRLAAGTERVELTEVLPEPERLWLRDSEQRYAAEFRCVYLSPAGEEAG